MMTEKMQVYIVLVYHYMQRKRLNFASCSQGGVYIKMIVVKSNVQMQRGTLGRLRGFPKSFVAF